MSSINLIQGNCLDILPKVMDESIDAIITDLPYGTSACKWDSVIPLEPLWKELKRIIKPEGAIVLNAVQPFTSLLISSNYEMYKYNWVWEKPSGANFLNFKYQPAKKHEDICVFGKMATSYSKRGNMNYYPQMEQGKAYTQKSGKQKQDYGNSSVRTPIEQVITENKGERYPSSIQKFALDKDKLHPTQKPIALIEYLVKTYTKEDQVVLDCSMGSGTTGVACSNLKRNFIGIELNEEYYNIAKERIENH